MPVPFRRLIPPAAALLALAPVGAWAQTLNFYGVTGLVDMPSAEMQPDGELSANIGWFGPTLRNTLTFQITPRLQGSFRYSGVDGLAIGGFGPNDVYYDRSFDLRFRLLDEGRYMPAVTIGLQDFIGTGQFSGEYIVATKSLTPRVKVTGGVGWGRLGSYESFGSTGTRPPPDTGRGGKPNTGQWFRGPAALFGGVEWQVNDRLGLKVEYSSDAYDLEERQGIFKHRSPLNFGAEYQLTDSVRLGAYYLYGSELGLAAHIALNPRNRPTKGVTGPAARAVVPRPDRRADPDAWSPEWTAQQGAPAILRSNLEKRLAEDGLAVEALAVSGTRAELWLRNPRYDAGAQAIGRAARALTAVMPASVEVFEIVPVVDGMPLSKVRLRRSDIEALEHAPANAAGLRARAEIVDNPRRPADAQNGTGTYPALSWSISPYSRLSYFDPDAPVRGDLGLRFAGRVDIAPGLVLSGAITQKVAGNLDKYSRVSDSVLPHVRTDGYLYDREDTQLEKLTLAWYSRPGTNLYGRVTAGYLERMFGGVSAELLWKPVDSRLALGAEVNYARQRDFDQRFGFQNYSVVTGHVSAYYAFDNGFHGQVDVGRYLAGDWGATVALDREFANGWRVGAFATLTDVSFNDFGEGSFDKGIRVTIPLNWAIGTPTRAQSTAVLRPVQRDGGARLAVDGRLYETVREYHTQGLDAQWGRVWR